MNTVIRDGPTAIAASEVGTIAPTVRPIADAANDSIVTMPQNFANLSVQIPILKITKVVKIMKKEQITKRSFKGLIKAI